MPLKIVPRGKASGPWVIKGSKKPPSVKGGTEVFYGKKSDTHSEQFTEEKGQ